MIKNNAGTGINTANDPNEYIYARNHLIYEGFLNDVFSKRLDSAQQWLNKFPKSYGNKIDWRLNYNELLDASDHPKKSEQNLVKFYNDGGTAPVFLNPSLSYKLDKKIDDGYPATGKLWGGVSEQGYAVASRNCTDVASGTTNKVTASAKYDSSKDSTGMCILYFSLE